MTYPYEKNMTQAMLDSMLPEMEVIEEYESCRSKYKRARQAAWVSLPAQAASGEPVLHGARKVTENVAEYWRMRMQLAAPFLPPGYQSSIELEDDSG